MHYFSMSFTVVKKSGLDFKVGNFLFIKFFQVYRQNSY